VSNLERFEFPVTGQAVRTVDVSGETMFVAADVCAILGHTEASKIVKGRLDPDEFVTVEVPETDISTTNRTPNPLRIVVSESGLYSLILWSHKPEAKAFRKWVTSEVLPAVRRTGSYSVPSAPAQLSPRELAQLVIAEADRADAAEARAAELAPAADHWRTLAAADGDYSVADAAKILSRDPNIKLGRNRLFGVLHELGWAYVQRADHRYRAAQKAVERGRLSELPQSHYHPRTGELVLDPPQVRVTPKGLADLRVLLGGTVPLAITSDSKGL
jgi:prophage antirepressor-like protein